jgi:hypothetical protein
VRHRSGSGRARSRQPLLPSPTTSSPLSAFSSPTSPRLQVFFFLSFFCHPSFFPRASRNTSYLLSPLLSALSSLRSSPSLQVLFFSRLSLFILSLYLSIYLSLSLSPSFAEHTSETPRPLATADTASKCVADTAYRGDRASHAAGLRGSLSRALFEAGLRGALCRTRLGALCASA